MTPTSLALTQTQTPLSSKQVKSPDILSIAKHTLPLLKEYQNNGLQFYKDLYANNPLGVSFAFFGHDFSGCYGIDTTDNHIKYATKEDDTIRIILCNSTVENFHYFNNLFIDLIHEKITSTPNDFESKITDLRNFYSEKDPLAMECDENFWSIRLYELEEDFFPLDDSKINLYSKHR